MSKCINAHETIKYQSEQMILAGPSSSSNGSSNMNTVNYMKNNPNRFGKRTLSECFRCGRKGHYATDEKCPAKNQKCQKCSKFGHFAVQCRTLKRNYSNQDDVSYKFSKKPKMINAIRTLENDVNLEESFIFNMGETDDMFEFCVGGVQIDMLIDSGSFHNIIDFTTWQFMQQSGVYTTNYV